MQVWQEISSGDTVTLPNGQRHMVVGINHMAGYIWLSGHARSLTKEAFEAMFDAGQPSMIHSAYGNRNSSAATLPAV